MVISDDSSFGIEAREDYWVGIILSVIGGARDSSKNSIFQIIDVDTGIIRDEKLFYIVMESNTNEKETIISEDCCPVPVATSTGEKCC